ncbi:MAG: hypothetical protein IPK19_23000 [Chloroflexi bacterium]|nr:hypothetical protein [Chloroflexota bacterium]
MILDPAYILARTGSEAALGGILARDKHQRHRRRVAISAYRGGQIGCGSSCWASC